MFRRGFQNRRGRANLRLIAEKVLFSPPAFPSFPGFIMDPILLHGRKAFSGFRLAALRSALAGGAPGLTLGELDAVEVYLVEADGGALDGLTRERALALLGATGDFGRADGFFVTPRRGTISPWSSKATDIFHNCGLAAVRRVERGIHFRVTDATGREISAEALGAAVHVLHDRMTEAVYEDLGGFFAHPEPAPLSVVALGTDGAEALRRANVEMGLALSEDEIEYLLAYYASAGRDPTDVELVMFSQVNSEHCRHKIFNADWVVDGEPAERSLFKMIRHTHARHPEGCLVAYSDNSGVLEGFRDHWFEVAPDGSCEYRAVPAQLDILCKVETHNHPTAISPWPGAATGVGGEIRDEGATGRGGRSKAGLSAFIVSHLRLPEYPLPWEEELAEFPGRLASPLEIMTDGPIGGAAFGNEFGRPQLCGLFRTMELRHAGRHRGYHKPIMAAGGMGNLKREHVEKKAIGAGSLIIQLGGPAMKIGLGGGAASSIGAGSQSEDLDFDSVQRGNAEMERRCQQVIDACIALGADNPILSIHDIGAGGLSNGCPELVEATGGRFHLRRVHNEDRSMSPMELWCCEAQERYVLAVSPDALARFEALCARERCPHAVIGEAIGDGRLTLEDEHFGNRPIDLDLGFLLGKPPKMLRDVARLAEAAAPFDGSGIDLAEAADRVLRFPAVADKTFLITIADRSITGLVARDQMVGPWQTPVADCAVTTTSMESFTGEAMAMGERTPLALLDAPASGRMAVGECLTNLAGAAIGPIGNVKLSANWMAACGEPGEDAKLFDTVRAVGMELCPALGIAIPVGKDSMSMRTVWTDSGGREQRQSAPLSLLVTGFSPVSDVRRTLTPELRRVDSALFLVDLGAGRNRIGGSVFTQVYGQVGNTSPDLDDPARMKAFFAAIQEANEADLLLAYHDRSDGGLFAALAEMAFTARLGLDVRLDPMLPGNASHDAILRALFCEELGAVVQVDRLKIAEFIKLMARHGLEEATHAVATPMEAPELVVSLGARALLKKSLGTLHRAWSELSYRMQARRDNPECAKEEYDRLLDGNDNGLQVHLTFDPDAAPSVTGGARPRVAILREQGVNGHNEMAAAFDRAGFTAVDVHMTDLLAGRADLKSFAGLAACGGFSYGDVLGAGSGWAKSVLYNEGLKDMFARFFARGDSFALGVCNGCQMLSQLKSIIPGAENWPAFSRNRSEQFEARYANVEVLPSPSLFLAGMEGSLLPVPVAHGEGRADFSATGSLEALERDGLTALRYIDSAARPAESYPFNPNGSPGGHTGFTTPDGRVTVMMPHPERCFRSVQMSYRPEDKFADEAGPWLKLFRNARAAVT